ncbi:hypothetical protein B4U80_03164 [Leptotrombidium deliense]|uniref:Uncharacterized protein n=1 Tax=Leptotrombidium deliense TaxID=299467 RepID=A0A443S1R3_9ACAR|nr:hypothetical protein B4U80_03164 [Leptotrombidium deliense]
MLYNNFIYDLHITGQFYGSGIKLKGLAI